ncbi:hypothetical protein M405DRAFT_708883, partial [Rhizopogon salebrosus TDB-379]
LEYIITHIFSPIKLPQHEDHTAVLDVVLGSARNFKSFLPHDDQEQWDPLLKMLKNLGDTTISPSLMEDIESQIGSMQAGGKHVSLARKIDMYLKSPHILAYLIRAQNAAVVLRRLDAETVFESFEVSPSASDVMAAEGKLLCSYPGPAITVLNSVIDGPTFPPELANFLTCMNYDVLDSAPSTTTADSEVLGERDTAHPKYITELLTGILRAFGEPANIPRIRKRIGDDVLWSDAELPWRRSSLWLVIRVVLQTSLERTSLGRKGYKAFMASLMTDLVRNALEEDLSSDLLYFMSTKIARRMVKLQPEDGLLAMAMHKATKDIKDRLELRWKDVQVAQAKSPHWDESKIDAARDTRLSLTQSEEYIVSVLHHTHVHSSMSEFQPNHRKRGGIDDFLISNANFFNNAYAEDPFLVLSDFECAIERDIDGWVDRVINLHAARIDEYCLSIQACATSYSSKAQSSYSKNPQDISIMLLTLFELWVALDKLVIKSIPLLKEYSPEVPVTIFDRLLLQQAAGLERLKILQQYVAARNRDARQGFSVFSDHADGDMFAVRYYAQSEDMQSCKRRIESDACHVREMQVEELGDKEAKYERLTKEIDEFMWDSSTNLQGCDTYRDWQGSNQHNSNCRKCKKQVERDSICIDVHEWPLPEAVHDAEVVVFELRAPTTFKVWRSVTFHFLHDICTPARNQVAMATQYMLLPHYMSLSPYYVGPVDQRITLGSRTKSFLKSHYHSRSLPCTRDEICVNNRLHFRLYDTISSFWASGAFLKADIADICTYQVPPGPYSTLQHYLSGTQHTFNEVLANQAICHADLTLHEYIAFGSLRSGNLLQWMNILRELRARTLTFRDPAVHLLLLQACLEVGELLTDGFRAWHDELGVSDFGHTLLDELQRLEVSVETNWQERITMAMISALVSRLLSSAEDSGVIQKAHKLLRVVRNATFKWVQELSKALQGVPDENSSREYQARVRDMAAICRSTYDVGPDHISALLQSPNDLEILIYCSVTVKDNVPVNLHALPPVSRLLLERDRRLSYFLETYVRHHVEGNQGGFDQALKSLWSVYKRHTPWAMLDSPHSQSRWLRCETAPSDDPSHQIIHLDMLTGRLLVDGKPLARLPECYMQHPSYDILFGHQVLIVFPTKENSVEFVTNAPIHGFEIFFGMREGGDVVIRSKRPNGHLLELIPAGKLKSDVPALLVYDHVHWLNLSTRAIEFRPVDTMWETSDDNWVLEFTEGGQSVAQRGKSALFDIRSPTFLTIASKLEPLEDFRYLLVTCNSDISHTVVKVDLPLYGLSFFIDSDGELQSHDRRGMVVDENQSTGTLLGLVNQLVLRPKDRETYNNRHVIIPQGNVSVEASGHHVRVTIRPSSKDSRRHYHWYTVDVELCRLTGNVGLTNKLYKAYLHAVCTAHVPDPLTKRTGLEEAMYLLQSAACYSFMKLDPFDSELLTRISSLTVDRTWYASHRKNMQKVHWYHGLSSYVQSCAFYHTARNIVQYAKKLQVLSEAPVVVCSDFTAREEFLLKRGSQRSMVLYARDIINSFYPIQSSSTEHTARDLVRCSVDEQRVFECASMVRDWSTILEPCQALYEVFLQWGKVHGETRDVSLQYDRKWLKPDLGKRWMSVYELCRGASRETHTFKLAFTLSAMTYSSDNMELAVTMFAFAAIPDFRTICSPGYNMYDLSFGIEPLEQDLCQLISSYTTFGNSPEVSMSRHSNENYWAFSSRRRDAFEVECVREQRAAINILLGCFPRDSVSTCAMNCLSSSRYNKFDLTAELNILYPNCYRNNLLKKYLDDVQNVLDEARRTFIPSVKQTYAFTPSNSSVVSLPTVVPTEHLFRNPPPTISVPSDPLKQSHDSDKFSSGGADLTPLGHVISTFLRCRSDKFGRQYAAHLEESRNHLEHEHSPAIPRSTCCTDILQYHDMWCTGLYNNAFHMLEVHLTPSGLTEEILFNSGQWPRITVTFLLGLLASTSKTPLCDAWKTSLTNFAHILLRLQRSRRLLNFKAAGGDHEDFLKELDNDGYQGVDNTQVYVDWLLIQAENRFLIRRMQASVAMEMISPSSGGNTALQLHMGEGKSSVIIPICCAALADHSKLIRVVVLKPLAVQMFQLLVERLGGLTNRRIFYLPFSRSLRTTPAHAEEIQSLLAECQRIGGILVTQPDHILSFKLMTVEQQLPPADAGARPSTVLAAPLLSSQRWLDMHTRDLLDESDELLHVHFQLVYTMGDQKHLEGYPDRWTTTQQVMTLVSEHAHQLHDEFPLAIELQPGAVGSFPRFRILDIRAGEKLVQLVSDDILDSRLPNFTFEHVPPRIKDAIRKCFTVSVTDEQYLDQVRQYCAGSSLWGGLLLIRGLLAHGILVYALKERRWRIDYGLDHQRTMLAVPYRAKDVPSCRAEFGHPDIAIILTCLSYYYGGLDEKQVAVCFGQLLKQGNPALEYETWIRGLQSLPESLLHLSGINMESAEQFTDYSVPHFWRNKTVIDFYLAQIVFPKQAKEFPNKLSCSAWDLAERKSSGLPTTGFSGTNDFRYLLPTTIEQHALAHQRATNARVLAYLLQPENDRYDSHAAGEGARELLQAIANQTPEIRVLLDVGAQVLDLQNHEVAKAWLEIKQDAKAAIYFNKHDELVVLTRDQVVEPFTASSFAHQVNQCVLYLDDAHTRGTDVKLPREFRAAVTLGPKVTKDRLVQGCMRMRKLGHGQSIMFFAPPEVDRSIR